ncbi:hypothetical protein NA78x_001847 [Anatilimnocola sp. NA78]|uniref:hypothetical protein n=1 Tax=Anatilimnocola sp. NA78 TaxID=3415683 RepID=UPI003CE4C84A
MYRDGESDQGTMTFTRSSNTPPATTPDGEVIAPEETGAGNDTTGVTANPTATGDNGTVGNPNGQPGNVTGNTSGSIAPNTSGTTTIGTATTGGTTEPASYWTTARANGKVTAQTNDPASANYWTRERANGKGGGSGSNGIGGGGTDEDQSVTSGTLITNFRDATGEGTWYAVDLGSLSLWYATTDSAEGSVMYVGYATGDTIGGVASVGASGIMEAAFSGSVFVGEVAAPMP